MSGSFDIFNEEIKKLSKEKMIVSVDIFFKTKIAYETIPKQTKTTKDLPKNKTH